MPEFRNWLKQIKIDPDSFAEINIEINDEETAKQVEGIIRILFSDLSDSKIDMLMNIVKDNKFSFKTDLLYKAAVVISAFDEYKVSRIVQREKEMEQKMREKMEQMNRMDKQTIKEEQEDNGNFEEGLDDSEVIDFRKFLDDNKNN